MRPTLALRVDTGKLEHELSVIPSVVRVGLYQPEAGDLFIGVVCSEIEPETLELVGDRIEAFAREHEQDVRTLFDVVDQAHADELLYASEVVYVLRVPTTAEHYASATLAYRAAEALRSDNPGWATVPLF